VNERLQDSPSLWFAGFVTDALKEFAEAHLTLRVLKGEPLPAPEEIGVSPPTYLNGLAETIGEMRRHVLDLIRTGRPEDAEAVLDEMDEFYALLMTFDYPEAVSLGLRRRTDAARGFVERTRGDVTNALQQARLEAKMAQLQARIDEG
jgi:translin